MTTATITLAIFCMLFWLAGMQFLFAIHRRWRNDPFAIYFDLVTGSIVAFVAAAICVGVIAWIQTP